ncbi:hypothetical protein [Leisingera sp.]|jgi:hypothetical protein|uniref:hypothetical protein n=1 Tax=Leisingera sp. TaxID=1879318 RepID=UPI002B26BDA4|nr:hypothetical protein [Leisingera sp.]
MPHEPNKGENAQKQAKPVKDTGAHAPRGQDKDQAEPHSRAAETAQKDTGAETPSKTPKK